MDPTEIHDLTWTLEIFLQKTETRNDTEVKLHEIKGSNWKILAYTPNRAMVELRHSSSLGNRATSSPMKRDEDSSPLVPDRQSDDDDDRDRDRHSIRDRPYSRLSFQSLCPYFGDDARVSPYNSRISLLFIFLLVTAGLIAIFSIVKRLVSSSLALCFALFTRIWFIYFSFVS